MNKVLRMKDDIMFKAFFSKKDNERFLEEFLSSILKEPVKIKSVIEDAKLEQLSETDKYGVLDLDVVRANGEIINIEMQLQNQHNIEKKTSYYGAKKLTEQISIGVPYKDLKNVIVIAILDYNFLEVEDYCNEAVTVLKGHKEVLENQIQI